MRAIVFTTPGGPEVLEPQETETPTPGPGELRVRVLAAGVQPVDLAVRSGWSPPGAPPDTRNIPGNEFAGVVDAVGQDVAIEEGAEVLGFRVMGSYAEYVVVPASHVVRKPEALSWAVAGGLPGAAQTAHTVLEDLAVAEGETFLVHAAAGAVGTVAVQLAVRAGARVIGTASEANHDYLRSLGAIPVAYGAGLTERLRELGPIDVCLDAAGEEALLATLPLIADRGRIGTIAAFAEAPGLGVRWLTSRRSAARLGELVDLVASGELRITVRRTYPLERAADAHRDVGTGHGRGKVVLTAL